MEHLAATTIRNRIACGAIKSIDIVRQAFAQIEKSDSEVQAYLTLFKDQALQQAEAIDQKIASRRPVGALAGVPVAVSDNICTAFGPTTCGSKMLQNFHAPYNAHVIEKLLEADAVLVGKTNLDEFAMGSSTEYSGFQQTRNPWNLSYVPGGSSGGSAAAVAARMCCAALGSDTDGSIRQPAAFCGVVGLKPTYGRVSRSGVIAMASSLDQVGSIASSVEDAAIVLSEIAGQDLLDATSAQSADKRYEDYLFGDISGKTVGVPKEYMDGLDGEIREVFEKSLEKFKSLGAKIETISLPNSDYALPAYYIIMPSEVSSNLARYDGIKYGLRVDDQKDSKVKENGLPKTLLETYLDTRKIGFGDEVKRRIMLGTFALSAGYYDAYYLKAQKVRALIRKDFENAFEKVDFIYCPTAPEIAFKFGEKSNDLLKMYLSDIYTITANLSGTPAISFPIGNVNIEGKMLPVGGQLMAKWFDEEGLLNAAHTFEIN